MSVIPSHRLEALHAAACAYAAARDAAHPDDAGHEARLAARREAVVVAALDVVPVIVRAVYRRHVPRRPNRRRAPCPPDLIQEGYIALLRAADTFDPTRAALFHTYLHWWIRSRVSKACDRGPIRVPLHLVHLAWRARRAALAGRPLPLSRKQRERIVLAEQARDVLHYGPAIRSPRRAKSGRTRQSGHAVAVGVVADRREVDPAEEACARADAAAALAAFRFLDPRWAEVLRRRYGLGEFAEQTLEEVGQALGITRERVRQIEQKALAKVRARLRAG
jgi:RNA polymerase primary sigma factor